MLKNNIEVDVKVKCIEAATTQAVALQKNKKQIENRTEK